jgi:CheY-like chemotaxis protein/two-component sensor histidine kinase
MDRQVQHLVRLVDDLLDVSRVMRGKIELRKERIELATVIARAVETAQPFLEAHDHHFKIHLPAESLMLHADPVRLAQVIANLLTNAAKYTEPNGLIQLSAEREQEQVTVRVRDNGIGIDPSMLPHIFELFVQVDHASTRSQGGLGLGLTLVKSLVEMHGGAVAATSAGLGKGSEFSVRLPLSIVQAPRQSEEQESKAIVLPPSGHRLLVVDDNKDAANSLAVLLRLKGHDVRVTHDGPSALETADKFRPEIIFLDIGMPGMDGYEVARRIRENPELRDVVLTAITGWGQQEDRRRSQEAGFNHHLVKPPEARVLENVLDELKGK